MSACSWISDSNVQCKKNVLMDGMCCRHLKQKCAICFELVKSTNSLHTKRLSCGHSYHFQCIITWFETSDECPVCRQKQMNDPILIFKEKIENKLRKKYMSAIRSLEHELATMRRLS
jgi:hypothetical protein